MFDGEALNALGDERYLNKKTRFISKCRHQNKLLLKNIAWINCSVFYIISFYESFCFSLRTSGNVHLVNVQYMKLGVVYSTIIAFWKPIYQLIYIFILIYI